MHIVQKVFFTPTLQTGDGSEQLISHDLGKTPDLVIIQVTDEATATATLGTHTSSVIKATVTNAKTYKVIAFTFEC